MFATRRRTSTTVLVGLLCGVLADQDARALCPSGVPARSGRPELILFSPENGDTNLDYDDNGTPMVLVEGRVRRVSRRNLELRVNGVLLSPQEVKRGGSFSWLVPADHGTWFQTILVEARDAKRGTIARERRIVQHGPIDPAGQLPGGENAFVHVTSQAFNPNTLTGKLEPRLRDQIASYVSSLDLNGLVRSMNPIEGYRCVASAGICHVWINEVNLTNVSLGNLTSYVRTWSPPLQTGLYAQWDIGVVDFEVRGSSTLVPFDWNCRGTIELYPGLGSYLGQYGTGWFQGDLTVYQTRPTGLGLIAPTVRFTHWEGPYSSNVCPGAVAEWQSNIEGRLPGITDAIRTRLDQFYPQNMIARTIESNLDEIDIVGPLADGLDRTISTEYGWIDGHTNDYGITYPLRTNIEERLTDTCAPQPSGAYSPPAAVPTFNSIVAYPPVLNYPYDIAMGFTPGILNQHLAAMVAEGGLTTTVREFNGSQLDVALLRAAVPTLSSKLRDDWPVEIEVYPSVAPIVEFAPGPTYQGFRFDLRNMIADVNVYRRPNGPPTTILRLAFDLPMQFWLLFENAGRGLRPAIYPPGANEIRLEILQNPYQVPEETIRAIAPVLILPGVEGLTGGLESFSLPSFEGYQLAIVASEPFVPEGANNGWYTLYLQMTQP
jgi:hypothetical protein